MTNPLQATRKAALAGLAALASSLLVLPATAQEASPSNPAPAAQPMMLGGVPVSALAASAPERYQVQAGDTLWSLAQHFLRTPWRWPELWGLNQAQIQNPHRIYPGQWLRLERHQGVATLRMEGGRADDAELPTVRLAPRQRLQALPDGALPTLQAGRMEAFLAEPLIVDAAEMDQAARIVSTQEGRVLLSRGDRAYARGAPGTRLRAEPSAPVLYRVFRSATPLKDPETGLVLGYEAVFAGKARLLGSETSTEEADAQGATRSAVVPAALDIISAKEEIRVGDRLLPEPPRELRSYTPHAAPAALQARIVSVYGSAVENAAQNQVVAINRGAEDGVDAGMVLTVFKNGAQAIDKEDTSHSLLKMPDEPIGMVMVFRTFARLSYALILDITDGVRVGDRLLPPR